MGRWWMDTGALVASSPSSSSFLPKSPVPRPLYMHKRRGIGQTETKMGGVGHVASSNSRDFPSDYFDVRQPHPLPHSKQGGLAKGISFSFITSITKAPSYHDSSPKSTTPISGLAHSVLHGGYLSSVRGGER